MKNLTLFAHPTTILIVDDDPVYLRNLALALSSRWAVRTTSSPKRAIEFMRAANEPVFTLEQAYRRVFDPHRFKTPAILVADYDMPEMNGLELCDALRDASVETILLTGKADKKTAVNAFNEGLISRFLNKQTPDVLQFLTQYFSELNQEFFTKRYSYSIHETRHETDGVEFLRDRAFIKTFLYPAPSGLSALRSISRRAGKPGDGVADPKSQRLFSRRSRSFSTIQASGQGRERGDF